jgi:Lamin Tail Domain
VTGLGFLNRTRPAPRENDHMRVALRLLVQGRAVPRLRLPSIALLIALVAAACGDNLARSAAPDAGPAIQPDAAPPAGQGSLAATPLVLNELAPDSAGGPDWLEIVNRSDAPIDLCGYFVTDALDRLDHYYPLGRVAPPDPCPPRMLGAGEYLVVLADDGGDGTDDGLDHAGFKLAQADELHLVAWTGLAQDSLLYLQTGTRHQSLARSPDRDGLFYPGAPTPGAPNPEPAP